MIHDCSWWVFHSMLMYWLLSFSHGVLLGDRVQSPDKGFFVALDRVCSSDLFLYLDDLRCIFFYPSQCAAVARQLRCSWAQLDTFSRGLEGQKDREAWKTQAETEEVRGRVFTSSGVPIFRGGRWFRPINRTRICHRICLYFFSL